jgi:hypothetical protein
MIALLPYFFTSNGFVDYLESLPQSISAHIISCRHTHGCFDNSVGPGNLGTELLLKIPLGADISKKSENLCFLFPDD